MSIESKAEWQKAHRASQNKASSAWKKRNPERVRSAENKRRALQQG